VPSWVADTYYIIIIILTWSDQPKPPAVAIVHQNGLSSASSRASIADTPVSWQIGWTQVVDGRPQVRLHSCEGRSPSLLLAQIRSIRFAGTLLRSRATWPKTPSLFQSLITDNRNSGIIYQCATTNSRAVFVIQKQNKNEFCVIELHVATSDVVKSACEYRCGIAVHVIDMMSPAKVRCAWCTV